MAAIVATVMVAAGSAGALTGRSDPGERRSPQPTITAPATTTTVPTPSTTGANVAMPDVVGLAERPARDLLEQMGFDVEVTNLATSDPAQDGIVLGQGPPATTRALRGATASLAVGKLAPDREPDQPDDDSGDGSSTSRRRTSTSTSTTTTTEEADLATVPDVVGLPHHEARTALEASGFVVATADDEPAPCERDPGEQVPATVVSQAPEAGTHAERGATVTLAVDACP